MTVNDGLGVKDRQKKNTHTQQKLPIISTPYWTITCTDTSPCPQRSKIKYLYEIWLLQCARGRTCTLRAKKNYSIIKKLVYINI